MIPLDRVRELLSLAPGPHGGTLLDTSFVHDLARDVLSLADALATAERERDTLRGLADALRESDVRLRAEAAGLRAIYDAVDELAFCDHAAEVESYCETVPGSHAAAQARAGDAYDALMRLRDAESERRADSRVVNTPAAASVSVAWKAENDE